MAGDRELVAGDGLPRGGDADALRPHGAQAGMAEHLLGQVSPEDVGGADEPGHEDAGGPLVDLARRPDLFDGAQVEHRDPVAHGQRLVLVVGDEDERDADVVLDRLQLDLHLLPELQVEGPEGLVQQEHLGPVHEGASQGHPLPLAAGELVGATVAVAAQPHAVEGLVGAALPFGLAHPLDPQPVLDVLADVHVREEGVVLEHRVDVPVVGRQVRDLPALQEHGARARRLEAGDHPQHRGLARSRRAEHGEELAVTDGEIDGVDGDHRAELLAQVHQLDGRGIDARGPGARRGHGLGHSAPSPLNPWLPTGPTTIHIAAVPVGRRITRARGGSTPPVGPAQTSELTRSVSTLEEPPGCMVTPIRQSAASIVRF